MAAVIVVPIHFENFRGIQFERLMHQLCYEHALSIEVGTKKRAIITGLE